MKKLLSLTGLLLNVLVLNAQVEKQIILEHFTNTVCSVCASKNPGLNSNLQNNPDIIRISYHPSSPYSSCAFNLHNVSGNDDRTNQYNIYGATPRIVIQGDVISASQSYNTSALFDGYRGQTSPVLLNTYIDSITTDSTYITVSITTVDNISILNYLLYIALAEEEISYAAPNGENIHHNVFRKALNGNQGIQVTLTPTIGDSIVLSFKTKNHLDWNLNELIAISTIQKSTNFEVVQASTSNNVQINNSSVKEQEADEEFKVHFNRFSNQLSIFNLSNSIYQAYEIVNITGQIISQGRLNSVITYVNLATIPQGIYVVRLTSSDENKNSRSVKFVN